MIDKSLVSGSISLMLLNLLSEQDMYGYQMIEALERRSNDVFSLKAGTLYPILHSLEQQGAVESYESRQDGARIRKYYRITKKGVGILKSKKQEWQEYSFAVNKVLGGINYAKA